MNYNQVFCAALQRVIDSYKKGEIQFLTEHDLQSYLFSECVSLMKQYTFPHPLKVFAERTVPEKGNKIDLVLGDDEVLVELKFEPVWEVTGGEGRVFVRKKDSGGSDWSIEKDLEKIRDYAKKGTHAHFVMIDENGWHSNKIEQSKWTKILTGRNQAVLLHIYEAPVT